MVGMGYFWLLYTNLAPACGGLNEIKGRLSPCLPRGGRQEKAFTQKKRAIFQMESNRGRWGWGIFTSYTQIPGESLPSVFLFFHFFYLHVVFFYAYWVFLFAFAKRQQKKTDNNRGNFSNATLPVFWQHKVSRSNSTWIYHLLLAHPANSSFSDEYASGHQSRSFKGRLELFLGTIFGWPSENAL